MIYFKPNIFILCAEKQICEKELVCLASLIQQEYQLRALQKMPFLFCRNHQDHFKLLYWDGDGFLLCYKRIENGKLKWPRTKTKFEP
ncbi:IS66 family insertion sequence element accessory protein TnpB [Enterococcus faecium]|nr:IS66 family insertion sequence element accessory protein TnpB [Enterococcus faecium]